MNEQKLLFSPISLSLEPNGFLQYIGEVGLICSNVKREKQISLFFIFSLSVKLWTLSYLFFFSFFFLCLWRVSFFGGMIIYVGVVKVSRGFQEAVLCRQWSDRYELYFAASMLKKTAFFDSTQRVPWIWIIRCFVVYLDHPIDLFRLWHASMCVCVYTKLATYTCPPTNIRWRLIKSRAETAVVN